jgi:hypothetical protein
LPLKGEHLQKSTDIEALAQDLAASAQVAAADWRLVMLHYAALHYIEGYFATRGVHSRHHPDRDDNVQRDPNTQPIYGAYSKLKMFSHNARYLTSLPAAARVAEMESNLATVKKQLTPFL